MQIPSDPQFWLGLGQITLINVVLSADNAIVIALAARSLPAHQQKQAVVYGTAVVVAVRIALTLLAAEMLKWSYLKFIGALLLFWIAVKLLMAENDNEPLASSSHLLSAIRTILIADLEMSLDNVIGVAAAARGNTAVLVAGLVLSIPLVVFGAAVLMKWMARWPVIITIGAALLGWVAGDLLMTDPAWGDWVGTQAPWLRVHLGDIFAFKMEFTWMQAAGAALVLLVGKCCAKKTAVPV
jgi:YjbE family integral membrane protein